MKPIFFLAMALLLMTGCSDKTSTATPAERTEQTMNLLHSLKQLQAEGRYMFGHEDDPCYGVGWVGDSARSDVKSVCGDWPAVMGFDLGHIELGNKGNLDDVPFDLMHDEILRHYKRGGMVTLSWHLDNPLTGGSCWAEDPADGEAVAAILEDGAEHEKFLAWLDRVADFLNGLVDNNGVHVPILFRPWHEHNASWFWYGQEFCTAEQYKELWRITVNRLSKQGVTNVLYAYSPSAEVGIDEQRYMERYPGDDIIDVMGLDCYCQAMPGDTVQIAAYAEALDRNLDMLCSIAQQHQKAAALTEAGFEGVPADDWWTATLAPALSRHHVSYALVWRNAHNKPGHFYAPYPGHPSASDFVNFYNLDETLFLRDVNGLYLATQ